MSFGEIMSGELFLTSDNKIVWDRYIDEIVIERVDGSTIRVSIEDNEYSCGSISEILRILCPKLEVRVEGECVYVNGKKVSCKNKITRWIQDLEIMEILDDALRQCGRFEVRFLESCGFCVTNPRFERYENVMDLLEDFRMDREVVLYNMHNLKYIGYARKHISGNRELYVVKVFQLKMWKGEMEREGVHNECVCEFAFLVDGNEVIEVFVR
jgi:hypothetical protein